jgi:phosphoribosylformimino-5-aminoimidazole carboxamide ribotide isomerase
MQPERIAEPSLLQRSVLPVLDLMGGRVVRGVGGRRSEYRPIVSTLTTSSEPLAVANVLRENFGFQRFYVADLDAIAGGQSDSETLRSLAAQGLELTVDAGVTCAGDVRRLLDIGARRVILGLESLDSPMEFENVLSATPAHSLAFSLDMKDGRPIANLSRWPADPSRIADLACDAGINDLIVLDLAAVGMKGGLATAGTCRQIRNRHPKITMTTGGGIRTTSDIEMALSSGADFVLVATALHDGSLAAKPFDAS